MPEETRPRKIISSLQRALDILNLFESDRAELGNAEIARMVNLPVGTVAGLVYTLKVNGYLAQNPANRKYRLGFKLAERAMVLFDQLDLRRVAMPHLEKLREWCGESINLALQDGCSVVYIERLFGHHSLGIRAELGKHAAIHSTALGKAIMAFRTPEEIRKFIAGCSFTPVTRYTIVEEERFLAELDLIRRRGFALDEEENEIGGRCVAAPVFDQSGNPVAAVSISVPIQRLPSDRIAEFGKMAQIAAANISSDLGFAPRANLFKI